MWTSYWDPTWGIGLRIIKWKTHFESWLRLKTIPLCGTPRPSPTLLHLMHSTWFQASNLLLREKQLPFPSCHNVCTNLLFLFYFIICALSYNPSFCFFLWVLSNIYLVLKNKRDRGVEFLWMHYLTKRVVQVSVFSFKFQTPKL